MARTTETVSIEDLQAGLESVLRREGEDHISRGTLVGRAAVHLLAGRTSADFPASPDAALPKGVTRIHDARIQHKLSIHNSSISGDPARVSLLRQTMVDGIAQGSTVVSMPQDAEAAAEFRQASDGLFVLEGTHRTFAAADTAKYEQELALGAGMLLEIMQQVELESAQAEAA